MKVVILMTVILLAMKMQLLDPNNIKTGNTMTPMMRELVYQASQRRRPA